MEGTLFTLPVIEMSDWRATLFVWQGEAIKVSAQQILWKGAWVGTTDPVDDFPSLSDFEESQNVFEMYLNVSSTSGYTKQSYDSNDQRNYYLLDNGEGLERYQDIHQEIYISDYHNNNSHTDDSMYSRRVMARGNTEFGSFVSYGKWTSSGQLTLARRYVDEKDWRLKVEPMYLLFQDLLEAVTPNGTGTMIDYSPWHNLPVKCKRPRNSGLNEDEVKHQIKRMLLTDQDKENKKVKTTLPPMKLLPISSNATIQKCSTFQSDLASVYITSYPKSGTTMLQHIVISLFLAQAKRQKSEEIAAVLTNKYSHVSKYAPFYEIDATWKDGNDSDSGTLADEYNENHKALGTHIFNTHLLYDMLPHASASNNRKCIYIVRNAKDACCSFYHHLSNQQQESGGISESNFQSFFQAWIKGDIVYGQWIDHMMHTFSRYNERDNKDLLILCYEDLLSEQGLRDNVQQIVAFLNLQLTKTDIEGVLPSFSFHAMKQNINRFQPISVTWKEGYSFLRKGVKGDANDTFFYEREEKEGDKKATPLEYEWREYVNEKLKQSKEAMTNLPEKLQRIVKQCVE